MAIANREWVISRLMGSVLRWFDAGSGRNPQPAAGIDHVDWARIVPFIAMHIACVAVFWVGVSPVALAAAGLLYVLRMFAITGFYHRYFSHRSFKTSRTGQFVFALLGASAVQRGPIWWAAHHRHHHARSDEQDDVHSPVQRGFLWSHMGWFLSRASFPTKTHLVKDLARFPELVMLDRFDSVVPALLAMALYVLGEFLERALPDLGTSGPQLLVWGFAISTVAVLHATFTINSLAHSIGSRRYETRDSSRNHWLLALLTFGEGWHNNHHRYPAAARQGFFWWEIDLTYYGLCALAALGLISGLRPVPAALRMRPARQRA